jgi:NAD(P)-dependent dehydrogenase (short-subunit alcohol dehydrogenase family)
MATDTRRRPVAAVTGACRGIGLGIARALNAAGYDLVLLDLPDQKQAQAALAQLPSADGQATFVAFDLAQVDRHEAVADAVVACYGAPDCLVNNAGVQVRQRGDILDVEPQDFDRVMDINLRGTFFLTQAIARGMIAAGAPPPARGHRCIVTVSSINAVQPAPDRAAYCLSKAALSMMNQLFALRLAEAGICTYEIRPGIIRTEMTRPVTGKYDAIIADGVVPIARWGEPQDVGATVAMLASGGLPFSTGQALHVDGGMHIHKL